MCFFGTGFRVRACFFGSGFRDKVFLSLSQVSDPGSFFHCVSFTGSGVRVRVLDFMLRDWLVSLAGLFTLHPSHVSGSQFGTAVLRSRCTF